MLDMSSCHFMNLDRTFESRCCLPASFPRPYVYNGLEVFNDSCPLDAQPSWCLLLCRVLKPKNKEYRD